MKKKFHLGNIYFKDKVIGMKKVRDLIEIDEGVEIETEKVYSLIPKWEGLIQKRLGRKVEFSYISYSSRNAYLDVFITEDGRDKNEMFSEDIKIPKVLEREWQKYEDSIRNSLDDQQPVSQEADQGHFLSGGSMRQYEERFLELVPQYLDDLESVVQASKYTDQRATAVYLMQWQPNKQGIVEILLNVLGSDPDHSVHNSAARVLLALTHKAKIPSDRWNVVFDLLTHPTVLCLNKGLNLILESVQRQELSKQEVRKYKTRIEQLASVKTPNVSDPASDLLEIITGKANGFSPV